MSRPAFDLTLARPRRRALLALPAASLLLTACGGGGSAGPSDSAPAISEPPVPPGPSSGQALTLTATDGVKVYAMAYAAPAPRAVILLFHQGNSNYAEYVRIAPRLVAEGYSALAVDERRGGSLFGRANQTVQGRGADSTNLEALPDLEAAFAWADTQHLPIVVWGSSDSASLVFGLSARHADKVRAVLSFSPNLDEVESPGWAAAAAGKTVAPTFVASTSQPDELANAAVALSASAAAVKRQYRPTGRGVHGASMLDPERNALGSEEAWKAVLAFMKEAV